MKEVEKILSEMTLDEKIDIIAGLDFWHMNAIPSAGIPVTMLTDGPHGLRKQAGESDHLGLNQSVPSTCFPPACLSASSWDESALEGEGEAIAEECIQEKVSIVLGPGANIKRSPLCGRNFEYFSEDPYLAGKMAAAWIRGVEKRGIGTSLKHYAANNQEKFRLVGNSVVDARALREIYLKPFEIAVKEGRPSTVMCSYNRINNVYSCQNRWLLTDVLRKDWGFEGFVMTDWGAMADRIEAIKARLDLEMPGPCQANFEKVRSALEDGRLSMEELDTCIRPLVAFLVRSQTVEEKDYDVDAHHERARKIASGGFVLLENKGALPLKEGGDYVLIGSLAEHIRYQGAGSSKINPTRLDTIKDAFKNLAYAEGYDPITGATTDEMISKAIATAKGKTALVVLGLPDAYESEGFDRTSMDLPKGQLELVEGLLKAGVKVIALVLAGAPVTLPFRKDVAALMMCYLGGQALGSALYDVLTGAVNPSGKLAETFPLSLEDNPSYGNFSDDRLDVLYKESIMVGYRHYDYYGKEVAYPFGYGLSYTSFDYSDVEVTADRVAFTLKNTGAVAGSETAQLYIGLPESRIVRPVRELRGFVKVFLEPGEEKRVEIPLSYDSFAYFNVDSDAFDIEDGDYEIAIGASSRDLRLKATLHVEGNSAPYAKPIDDFEALFGGCLPLIEESDDVDMNTPLFKALETKGGKAILGPVFEAASKAYGGDDDMSRMMLAMLKELPLRGIWMMPGIGMTVDELVERIEAINKA